MEKRDIRIGTRMGGFLFDFGDFGVSVSMEVIPHEEGQAYWFNALDHVLSFGILEMERKEEPGSILPVGSIVELLWKHEGTLGELLDLLSYCEKEGRTKEEAVEYAKKYLD